MQKYAKKPHLTKALKLQLQRTFVDHFLLLWTVSNGDIAQPSWIYAVEIQAEIEYTSGSQSKTNLISLFADNVDCVDFLSPPLPLSPSQ